MRFFKPTRRTRPKGPARPAVIESMESRRLLSASGLVGADDGPNHEVNDNRGAHVVDNDRGRHGADDGANHDLNDARHGRDDGPGHH